MASVIPLSLLFAIILMNAFGVSGNLMSLGALDFGLIVDGAVIIVEAVLHRLHHGKHFRGHGMVTRSEMNEEVGTAAGKLMNAAVFGQIIILVVYLPILSLESIEGKMFKPMAQTVAFAILGAFLLSLTYIPMMSSLILSRKIRTKPNLADRILRRLEHWHETAMNRVLKNPSASSCLPFCSLADRFPCWQVLEVNSYRNWKREILPLTRASLPEVPCPPRWPRFNKPPGS